MQTNARKTPGRVYLHPASGTNPESIQRIQRETGMLVVIGTRTARLIPMTATRGQAVTA